jgi:hypothetical protein
MVLCSHQHYTKLIDHESRIPKPRFRHVKQNPRRKRRKEEKGKDSLTADLPCVTVAADLPCATIASDLPCVAVADIGLSGGALLLLHPIYCRRPEMRRHHPLRQRCTATTRDASPPPSPPRVFFDAAAALRCSALARGVFLVPSHASDEEFLLPAGVGGSGEFWTGNQHGPG